MLPARHFLVHQINDILVNNKYIRDQIKNFDHTQRKSGGKSICHHISHNNLTLRYDLINFKLGRFRD